MTSSAKAKILIIEDDKFILAALQELLELENYEVATANNGLTGLEYLNKTSALPRMILLDLAMPVMDGFEFRKHQELSERLSQIPVVLMSADGQLETQKIKIGIKLHLTKPIDLEKLMALVSEHCG